MKRISHILDAKGYDIWFLSPDATVYDAIEMMAKRGVGALLVMEDNRMIGIVSERDYAREVILVGKSSRKTLVREIMSSPVFCTAPEHTVEDTMAIMTEKHVRHLPVRSGEMIVGMISIGDVVRGVIEEREFEIQQLTNYITGNSG